MKAGEEKDSMAEEAREMPLQVRPGTIVSSSVLSSRRPSITNQLPVSPGVILKVQSPALHVYKGLFEISAQTLAELETRAQVLSEAASTRLDLLLSLPYPSLFSLQNSLSTLNPTLPDYFLSWKRDKSTNIWKLVRNWCYFRLVPELLSLHKAREHYQAAYTDYTQCIKLAGQRERQREMLLDTEKQIAVNKEALKELAKGKKPFIAGGAIHKTLSSKGNSRSKGKNPTQVTPKSTNSRLAIQLKEEITAKMRVVMVIQAWKVLARMTGSLKVELARVENRGKRVMAQYCLAIWQKFSEIRRENRNAYRIIRTELSIFKRKRVFEGWKDAISLPIRRKILIQKATFILKSREMSRIAVLWRDFAIGRRRKRLGLKLSEGVSRKIRGLKAVQGWIAAVILTNTLKIRVKAMVKGETEVPTAEDIELAAREEVRKGVHWQVESLDSVRIDWKACHQLQTALTQRINMLFSRLTPVQRTQLLAQCSHFGEHRSINELNTKAVLPSLPPFPTLSLVFPQFPSISMPFSPISDPKIKTIHEKYALHQRKYHSIRPTPKSVPMKPPLSPETRIKPFVSKTNRGKIAGNKGNLMSRVEADCARLIAILAEISSIPPSFFLQTAKTALQSHHFPLKTLLIHRYRLVQASKAIYSWKMEATRRKLEVVVTIRYAVRVGKRFIEEMKREIKRKNEIPKVFMRGIVRKWRENAEKESKSSEIYYVRLGLRQWKDFIVQKAGKLGQIVTAQRHYQTILLRKSVKSVRFFHELVSKYTSFRSDLYRKVYFTAWKELKTVKIRAFPRR